MEEIIIASGNKGKIKEAQEILKEFKIVSMKDLKNVLQMIPE